MRDADRKLDAEARARRAHLRLIPSGEEDEAPELADGGGDEDLPTEVMDSLARLREKLRAKLFAPNPATRPHWDSLPGRN